MKKILIYIHSYLPYEDSNTNCIIPIIERLRDNYEVNILACNINNNANLWEESVDGIKIYRFERYKGIKKRIAHLNNLAFDISFKSPLRKLNEMLIRPFAFILYHFFKHSDEKILKKLIKNNGYKCLITVTSPIRVQYVALKLCQTGLFEKYNLSWIPYFMDPYAAYIGNASKKDDLYKYEMKIYSMCRQIITTPEIFEDNKSNPLNIFIEKTIPIPLANLRDNKSASQFKLSNEGRINCLYSGSLQDCVVRNPEYLFKLIREIGDDFMFHLIVNIWCAETIELRKKYLSDAKNIIWYDSMSLDDSLGAMKNADILINLGNRCSNQLPGKVFDYVGTGKPIVNFYSYRNDTSKIFLDKYPIKLNINENDCISDTVLKFKQFCMNHVGSIVPYNQVKHIYQQYTTENVSSYFLSIIESVELPEKANYHKRSNSNVV